MNRDERIALLFDPTLEEVLDIADLDEAFFSMPDPVFEEYLSSLHNEAKERKRETGSFLSDNPLYRSLDESIAAVHTEDPSQRYQGLLLPDAILSSISDLIWQHRDDTVKLFFHDSCVTLPDERGARCIYAHVTSSTGRIRYHFPLHGAMIDDNSFNFDAFISEIKHLFGEESYFGFKANYRNGEDI